MNVDETAFLNGTTKSEFYIQIVQKIDEVCSPVVIGGARLKVYSRRSTLLTCFDDFISSFNFITNESSYEIDADIILITMRMLLCIIFWSLLKCVVDNVKKKFVGCHQIWSLLLKSSGYHRTRRRI